MNEIDEKLKKLFASARMTGLLDDEKKSIKEKLGEFMRTGTIRSPYVFHVMARISQMRLAGSVLALVLIASGGVTFASSHSLPGEALYPLKTGVTEKMEGFLVLSEKSKATFEVKLATRRLEEATLLAKVGKLDAEIQTEIAEDIQEHVEKASHHVGNMTKDEELLDAKEVSENLEETLVAHTDSLEEIGKGDADPEAPASPLLAKVREQVQVAQETHSKVEVEIASRAPEVTEEDFKDTEALDDIEEDFFGGDLLYKDELLITDTEYPTDTVPLPTIIIEPSVEASTSINSSSTATVTADPVPTASQKSLVPKIY